MANIGSFTVVLPQATTPAIENESIAVADTEQSYVMPDGVKWFELTNRGNSIIKYSYTSGESGTKYRELYTGETHWKQSLNTEGLTVYFQSKKVGDILEIESWT